jgi:hypothetical protein
MVARARRRGPREKRVTGRSRGFRGLCAPVTIHLDMTRVNVHRPPSQAVVAELVRAGVSQETALAMERWKAEEVLELLRYRPESALPGAAGVEVRGGAW